MSAIQCQCGAVTITFPQEQPLFASECGCVDCIGKLRQLEKHGGPAVPADIMSHDTCLVLYYAHDKMVVTGKENLTFTTVRKNSTSTNCVASCCHTALVVDTPFYHQGSGAVGSTDGSGIVMFFETMTPTGIPAARQLRCWIHDIPAAKLANMPELPSFYRDGSGNFQFVHGGELGFAAMGQAAKIPALEGDGQTFAQLLADCGGTVTVDPYC